MNGPVVAIQLPSRCFRPWTRRFSAWRLRITQATGHQPRCEANDGEKGAQGPSHPLTVGALRREWYCARPDQRLREAGQHGEVGVKRDLRQAANAERRQAVLVLEPAELAFNRGAARVEVAEAASLARDQRVAALGLE